MKQKLSSLKASHGKPVLILKKVFEKNYGLRTLKEMSKVLNGEDDGKLDDFSELRDDHSRDDIIYFQYAPITTVNVERSFTAYTGKTILWNDRRAFAFQNLKQTIT